MNLQSGAHAMSRNLAAHRSRQLPISFVFVAAVVLSATVGSADEKNVPSSSVNDLPVREVTVFKDGHAFVLHRGTVPTHEGRVHLTFLPSPVIGTFWPFSADNRVKLRSAKAGQETLESKRQATDVSQLLVANEGARVLIHEEKDKYEAKILKIPVRSTPDEPTNGPPQIGSVVMLKTDLGTRIVPISKITEVTFLDAPSTDIPFRETRNIMTLDFDWGNQKPQKEAAVGMTYLQKGIRWIPSYRITLDKDGSAEVELQATVLNEMIDLDDATLNLVIGVPSFDFQDTSDPFGLQQTVANLSQYFQQPSQTAHGFSNSIMVQTQVARTGEYRSRRQADASGATELPGSDVNEELHIFTVSGITLRKGERMVVPVGRWKVARQDSYTLTLPARPPREIRRNFNNEQQARLAQLFHRPKIDRVAELKNSSDVPFTTAPAIFLKDGKLMGQGMMTYTPVGGSVELKINKAVDLTVAHDETEEGRTPNARNWGGYNYDQIDVEGVIEIGNRRTTPVRIRVTRELLGISDEVGADGLAIRRNANQKNWGSTPFWWGWYSWPSWWYHLNVYTDLQWELTIPPGKSAKLPYSWHYFWRQ